MPIEFQPMMLPLLFLLGLLGAFAHSLWMRRRSLHTEQQLERRVNLIEERLERLSFAPYAPPKPAVAALPNRSFELEVKLPAAPLPAPAAAAPLMPEQLDFLASLKSGGLFPS